MESSLLPSPEETLEYDVRVDVSVETAGSSVLNLLEIVPAVVQGPLLRVREDGVSLPDLLEFFLLGFLDLLRGTGVTICKNTMMMMMIS